MSAIRMRNLVICAAAVGLLMVSCAGDAGDDGLRSIRLPMGFIPNVQYSPFYVADSKGYFAEEGLEVVFDYSTEIDGVALVGSGELSFSLASGEQVLLARERGVPVVYVMAWFQEFPVAIAARSDAGIDGPADLADRRIGIPGTFGASFIGYRAFLDALGFEPDFAHLESIGFNQVEAMATGQIPAAVVYANNEPVQLEARGIEVELFRVSDYVELASNGLITNEETLANDPELVRRMIRATLRGIEDVIEDPEEAYEISLGYVEGLEAADREIQSQVLAESIDIWRTDRPGYSSPEAWENMQSVLLGMELLSATLDLEDAFTNEYLPE